MNLSLYGYLYVRKADIPIPFLFYFLQFTILMGIIKNCTQAAFIRFHLLQNKKDQHAYYHVLIFPHIFYIISVLLFLILI